MVSNVRTRASTAVRPLSRPAATATPQMTRRPESDFRPAIKRLVDLGQPRPPVVDPGRIIDAVKKAVQDLSAGFRQLHGIASEYDPQLTARAGIEGVLHTGTSWLEQNVPFIGRPVGELVDRLFNKPPPAAAWPSPPSPVLPDPALDGELSGSSYRSTDDLPLFGPNGPQLPGDIRQRGLGDCYFMASMAGLTPDQVKDMIRDNRDGTYTVRLYDVASDGAVTPTFVTVSGDLPSPPGADYGADGKWVAIVEKAYAAHLGSYDVAAGNNNPKFFAAPTVLTGRTTVAYALPISDPDIVYQQLAESTAEGRPAFAGFYGPDHDGLFGNHAYTVEGVRTDEHGNRYVTLRNPWGYGELGGDGTPKEGDDGIFEMPLEDFMKTYQAVAVAGG